jgi:hypothetical protein
MPGRNTAWILILTFATGLSGCTSEEGRRRAQQAQIKRNIAQQDKLDAVEQKRSGNVYAHSCRKVTSASWQLNAVAVDKSGCSPEQLKLEEEAEKRQVFDQAFKDLADRNKTR